MARSDGDYSSDDYTSYDEYTIYGNEAAKSASGATTQPAAAGGGTLRQPLALADLVVELVLDPPSVVIPPSNLVVTLNVSYERPDPDYAGKTIRERYPDKWVQVLVLEETRSGPGPHVLRVDSIGEFSVVPAIVVKGGKTVRLRASKMRAVCGSVLSRDRTVADLACALFSEGGSAGISDLELTAVAWSIRNRLEALERAQKARHQKQWNYFSGRWYGRASIDTPVRYEALLRAPNQYTGIGGPEFRKCRDPQKNVTTMEECQRVAQCIRIAEGVFGGGTLEDPYRGKGNPDFPGVFYYKVKGNTPPHSGEIFSPLTDDDRHFHQGLDPDFAELTR